jgi:hypothetical protein
MVPVSSDSAERPFFTIAASCVAEAVAAHPTRDPALFDRNIVALDGAFLADPALRRSCCAT